LCEAVEQLQSLPMHVVRGVIKEVPVIREVVVSQPSGVCVAVWCSVLCFAVVCCSALQYVVVRCSVLSCERLLRLGLEICVT